ncbi:hypothetical protein GIB67_015956 [Kingdonia uniflora]|uniref:Uncharacterized protein n=1 Tax=Kingdonia uniflora TaxID=39325 RepID=A0A7J7PCA5_9MAGN|nr:hypothetical protein GIB67_015956 [Kingdonia uniflora]
MGSFNSLFQVLLLFTLINYTSILAERSTYIVYMEKSIMPRAFSSHHHWYSAILDSLKADSDKVSTSVPPKLFYTYNHDIHGFSVVLSPEELEALKKTSGCITTYPDHTLHVDTTRTTNFLSLNKVGGLWPALNYGTDAIIGVIDSRVWLESASFRDNRMGEIQGRWKGTCEPGLQLKSLMCNQKLIGKRYFNKGVLAQDLNISFVNNSPRDEIGHETQTTLIAAGNYVRGVFYFEYAKGTTKGSNPGGSRKVLLGLGTCSAPCARLTVYKVTWSREGSLTSDVIAGNRGSDLMTVVGNSWSLTVGASTIDQKFAGPRINNQISIVIELTVTGAIFISTNEREEYRIPEVTIIPMDAPIVIKYAKPTINPKPTIKFRQTFVGRGEKCAPQIPEYSIRGPLQSYCGVLKPDVVAPGSQVLAAWSPKVVTGRVGRNNLFMLSNYNIFFGTSIACPHASGVAAFLKGTHAYWSPAAIQSTMITTINPLDNTNNPILDVEF